MKATLLLLLLFFFPTQLICQRPSPTPRHAGILLFEQAKYSEAVLALEIATKTKEFGSDAEIWNYLGLALLAKDDSKKSRKALERSVALDPSSSIFRANLAYVYLVTRETENAVQSADKAVELNPRNPGAYEVRARTNLWQYKLDSAERDADTLINLDPSNPRGYLLKSDIVIAKLGVLVSSGKSIKEEVRFLKRAVETLEVGVEKCKASSQWSELVREYEAMSVFYTHYSREDTPLSTVSAKTPPVEAGVTPVQIKRQPFPKYTDRARGAGVEGSIRAMIVLGANGKVEHVLLLNRLGWGLDEEAVKAARAIKFEPKQKDGKPISSVIVREYTFDIY